MRNAVPRLTNQRVDLRPKRRNGERGQAAVFLVLALAFFLIGGIGLAVDGGNMWFHRQTAQTAADASCTAGAMDMLSVAAGVDPTTLKNSDWLGTLDVQCPGSGGSVCAYARYNGYSGSQVTGSKASDNFSPFADATCDYSHNVCPATDLVPQPYLSIAVNDPVPTTFMRFVGTNPTINVPARSTCGLSNVLSPVPVLVLNPNAPNLVANTFTDAGSLLVYSGPPKSVQVNSADNSAVKVDGAIDLSNANNAKGGAIAVAGRESADDAGVDPLLWINAAGVMSDPFATVPKPSLADAIAKGTNPVIYNTTPCPGLPAGVHCDLYQPGYYPPLSTLGISCGTSFGGDAAICVGSGGSSGDYPPGSTGLAVFKPGIYYLEEDFFAGPHSCLRPDTSAGDGDGSGGTIFYLSFHGGEIATLNVKAGSGGTVINSAGATVFNCADPASAVSVDTPDCTHWNLGLKALGTTQLTGNVLLAPCTGPYGDLTAKGNRGILFFHDRDKQPGDQPQWSGSGALVGNLYFHHCHSSVTGDSGANCEPDAFTETLNFDNGSNTYVVGGIVTDQLQINSGASVRVVLNPNPQYYVLKASLLQ